MSMYTIVHAYAYGFFRVLTSSPAPTESHHCVHLHCSTWCSHTLPRAHTLRSAQIVLDEHQTAQNAYAHRRSRSYCTTVVGFNVSLVPCHDGALTYFLAPTHFIPTAHVYRTKCSSTLPLCALTPPPHPRILSLARTYTVPGAHEH